MRGPLLLVAIQAVLVLVLANGGGRGGGSGSYRSSSRSYPEYARSLSGEGSSYTHEYQSSGPGMSPTPMPLPAYVGAPLAVSNDSSLEYLGCFKHQHRNHVFPDRVNEYNRIPITPSSCAKLCLKKGQQYSAVQYHSQCFCSNMPPPEEERAINETECMSKCHTDPSQICGGYLRMSVYFAEGNEWDKAYHEMSTLLSKISSIRELETKISTKKTELEKVQAELDEFRSRKSKLQKEISDSTELCSQLQLATKEVHDEEYDVDVANKTLEP